MQIDIQQDDDDYEYPDKQFEEGFVRGFWWSFRIVGTVLIFLILLVIGIM